MSIFNLDKISSIDVVRGWWAGAKFNNDFYCIQTMSGFRSGQHFDEKGEELYLTPDDKDETLGQAVLTALGVSRWILSKLMPGSAVHPDVTFDPETCNFIKEQKREQEWAAKVRKIYKYKSKRELYAPMRRCDIERKLGTITIKCRVHYPDKNYGDCWGFDDHKETPPVVLSDTASATEIGAGLRLAFSRCREIRE